VCLSVPTEVGCGGARQQIELPLSQKERLGIQNSARVLREIIDQVETRFGARGSEAAPIRSAQSNGSVGRDIPRSAWQPPRAASSRIQPGGRR
jgi:hypothetical protein